MFIYCCLWSRRRRRQEKLIHTGAYGRPTAIESSRSIHTPYVTYTALAKLTRSVCSPSAKKIRTHVQSVHMHFERMHAMRNVFETRIHFNSTEMIHHTYSSLHSGVDGIYTFFLSLELTAPSHNAIRLFTWNGLFFRLHTEHRTQWTKIKTCTQIYILEQSQSLCWDLFCAQKYPSRT